jgi:ribose 5-phosphate isomerase B
MKIYLGADHAGFELKETIKTYLLGKNYEVEDCGALEFNKTDDYPDFISKVALNVSRDPYLFGIIFGKSGAGECIVANKIKGVRAVSGFTKKNVELSRIDNDANILSLGSMFISANFAKELIEVFLNTKFSNEERHLRRINKIKIIENTPLS